MHSVESEMPGAHGGGCNCQEELGADVAGNEWLDKYIDKASVESRGSAAGGHAGEIFRPFSERLFEDTVLVTDPETDLNQFEDPSEGIVVSVPFTCPVKLTGITVIGGANGKSPSRLDLFSNITDFTVINELQPTQSVENLVEDFCGAVEHPVRVAKFAHVTNLMMRFPKPPEEFSIYWIGIRGVASGAQRRAVVTVYESRANVADHKVKENPFAQSRQIQ